MANGESLISDVNQFMTAIVVLTGINFKFAEGINQGRKFFEAVI
jgi:hypothetical protein